MSGTRRDIGQFAWASPVGLRRAFRSADVYARMGWRAANVLAGGRTDLAAADPEALAVPGFDPPEVVQAWEGKPVRLPVICPHDGHEPWFIQRDIPVEDEAGADSET